MGEQDKQRIIEFLKEYERLCRKYRLELAGCGCCGSPYVRKIKETDLLAWKNNFQKVGFTEKSWYSDPDFTSDFLMRLDGVIEEVHHED